MNLDNFKPLTKSITAPPGAPPSDTSLDSFIAKMRARDQQERRRLMGMALIYFSLGVVFVGAALGGQLGNQVIGVGIILVALYAGWKARHFGSVNYAAPASEFLVAAARRYQFWRAADAYYVIPLLLIMFVGGGLTVWQIAQKYFIQPHVPLALAAYLVFAAVVSVFGFMQGRKQWQRKSAVLLEEIHRRQRELDNG